jgi:hypothetical protein
VDFDRRAKLDAAKTEGGVRARSEAVSIKEEPTPSAAADRAKTREKVPATVPVPGNCRR